MAFLYARLAGRVRLLGSRTNHLHALRDSSEEVHRGDVPESS